VRAEFPDTSGASAVPAVALAANLALMASGVAALRLVLRRDACFIRADRTDDLRGDPPLGWGPKRATPALLFALIH
jgi:hypothetical protein